MRFKTSLFLCLISAILLILCFSHPDLGILAWIALVPFLIAIDKKGAKDAFFLSYFTGIICFLGILYWLIYVTFIGLIVLALYLGLYVALFGLLVSICKKAEVRRQKSENRRQKSEVRRQKSEDRSQRSEDRSQKSEKICPLSSLIWIPCAWVGLEFLRSYLFTGFGWALLGYSQYLHLPIIQISDISGAYGVSFLIVLVNVTLWQVISEAVRQKTEDRRQKSEDRSQRSEDRGQKSEKICPLSSVICFLLPILCLAASLAYGYFRLNQKLEGEKIDISVIQGNIPQIIKWDINSKLLILEQYAGLTRLAVRDHPEMIIWPETSIPGYLEEEPALWDKVSGLVRDINIPLLVGSPTFSQGKYFNSAVLISGQGKETARYDKLRLVPFGEYVPCESVFGFARSISDQIADFFHGTEHTIFSLPLTDPRTAKFAVLICFEDLFPDLVRRFIREGADFMVNITNDALFGKSTAPYQHAMASVFRAVENRVSLVRSANTGLSCFINPKGEITSRVSNAEGEDIFITAYKTSEITLAKKPTFYTHYGDIFAILCSIISLAYLALVIYSKHK